MNHPKTIEKRLFTCNNCGYSAQVNGESYFDYGSQNYIGTFLCKDCEVLFESYLTKIKEWDLLLPFLQTKGLLFLVCFLILKYGDDVIPVNIGK